MFNRHVIKELSAYLDNQLNEKKRQRIETHLRECKLCNEELSRLTAVSQKLKSWQAPDLSAQFDSELTNAIVRAELERGQVKMKRQPWAVLVPSAALAGILAFVFFMQVMIKHSVVGGFKDTAQIASSKKSAEYPLYGAPRARGTQNYASVEGVTALNGMETQTFPVFGGFSGYAERGSLSKDIHFGMMVPEKSRWTGSSIESVDGLEGVPRGSYEVSNRNGTVLRGYLPLSAPPAGEGPVIVVQPILPATGEGEKIIRTADVRLEVEDGKDTYEKASQICKELGGYLAASNFYKDKDGRNAGSLTMRIPRDNFLVALDKLNALGKIENSSTNSQDVAQQYANLKARLDAQVIVYNKMMEALQRRQTTINESLRLESELTPVLRNIEELKNAIENLNNAVSFTTINVYFHEPLVSQKTLKESIRLIKESLITTSINTIKFVARAIPALVVLVFWLIAAFGIGVLIKFLIKNLIKRG